MEMHFFNILSLSLLTFFASFSNSQTNTTFQVGVILDVDSLVGRIGLTSLSLALSDFYTVNANYSIRLVLNIRDSRGRVTGAAASALNLFKDVQVDAIIGPQKSSQTNFVIDLGDTAKVPVISFSATSPLHPQTPYFVQTALTDAAQVDAIAALVKYFQWYQVVFVYEDSDYGNGIIPYLSNAFQQVNARVSYRSVIPFSATDGFILRELYKMKTMQTHVFVLHISSSLASKFLPKAKEAEMMSEGYAWIVTSGLMDLFYSLDSHVVDSMQGVLGVKPLIIQSRKLRSTTVRWKEKFLQDNPSISQAEMSLFGLWAYDTMWGLAMAVERIGFREPSSLQNTSDFMNSTNMFITETSQTGPKLLEAMLDTTFEGLGGNFRLVNRQLEPSYFQVLNVAGNGLREVGIWTPTTRVSNERNLNVMSFSGEKLKGVIWPGESTGAPKGWEIPVSGKKLRVGVPAEAGFTEFVKVERDPQTNATKISGYYIDLFDSVMAALPYAVRYEYVPFETTDASISRSYDDLSYQVFNGAFELIVTNLARLVVVVWIFVVLILSSTYTASLSARLTAWRLRKSDTDVRSLIRNGDYVGCREGSFIVSYLKRLGFNETKIKTYKYPVQFDDALSKGSENGGITTLLSRTPYTTLFLSKYCNKYMKVGSPDLTEGFAFVFPKGSPLVADVSRAIIELTDNGRISEIRGRWMRDPTCSEDEPDPSHVARKFSINLKSFKVLFGITGGITATCLVVFLASYLYQNKDFIQRISNSGTPTWSKIRAMCKHFDQRDPKSFRSSRANEDGNQIVSPNPARWSTVVPISPEDMPSENRVVGLNSDNSTATAEQVRPV